MRKEFCWRRHNIYMLSRMYDNVSRDRKERTRSKLLIRFTCHHSAIYSSHSRGEVVLFVVKRTQLRALRYLPLLSSRIEKDKKNSKKREISKSGSEKVFTLEKNSNPMKVCENSTMNMSDEIFTTSRGRLVFEEKKVHSSLKMTQYPCVHQRICSLETLSLSFSLSSIARHTA
jgi:hypothetical protein